MADAVIKHVTGAAPLLLTDPHDPSNLDTLMTMINDMHDTPLMESAAIESNYLKSSFYFGAIDNRIAKAKAAEKEAEEKPRTLVSYLVPPRKKSAPPDFYKPGTLKQVFDYVAAETNSTIHSQIAILPQSLLNNPAFLAENDKTTGKIVRTSPFVAGEKPTYHLGFIQALTIRPNESLPTEKSSAYESRRQESFARARAIEFSTSFAILALDDDMLSAVAPHRPEKMLKALQTIITASNHDMLHHYVITLSRATHADFLKAPFRETLRRFDQNLTDIHDEDDPLGFESNLVVAHSKAWEELKSTPAYVNLFSSVNIFFDELGRIAKELKEKDEHRPQDQHKVVDYFSTAVGFSLMRILPLHDPLLQHSLDRMEQVDPAPELLPPPEVKEKRKSVIARTLENYKQHGTPLLDPAQPYKSAKQVELVKLVPNIALVMSPALKGSDEYKAHQRSDSVIRGYMNILSGDLKIK